MTSLTHFKSALPDVDSTELERLSGFLDRLTAFVAPADEAGDLPAAIWDDAPLELLNKVNIPPRFGGITLSATALARALLFESVGRVCPAFLMSLPGPGLAVAPVLALGTEPQKRWYFEHFMTDQRPVWGAFAITEPAAGSDATRIATVATPVDDEFELNGEKCFITNGERADITVVFATIAPGKGRFGIRAFMVPSDTPGFSVERTENMLGLRSSQMTALRFDRCRIPRHYMLGAGEELPRRDAFSGAQDAWNYMRPAMASGMTGTSDALLDWLDGELDRVAPTGHSALRDRVARYRQRSNASRLLALRAAWKLDQGLDVALDASIAKAYAADLANSLADELCGEFADEAMTAGHPVEKFSRDAKAFDILEGTGDMQRLMIANLSARRAGAH